MRSFKLLVTRLIQSVNSDQRERVRGDNRKSTQTTSREPMSSFKLLVTRLIQSVNSDRRERVNAGTNIAQSKQPTASLCPALSWLAEGTVDEEVVAEFFVGFADTRAKGADEGDHQLVAQFGVFFEELFEADLV